LTTAIARQIGQFIEKRSAEEALSLSRETLQLAQEAAQAGSFAWNLRTDKETGSASEERLVDLPAGGFDGRYENWMRSIHPEDRQRAVADAALAAERRRPLDTEFRTVGPNGEVRWIVARGRVFHDDQNGPAQMVGINIDITERKRAEQALLRSEERYRTFIQKSSEGIWRSELARPVKTDLSEDEQIENIYRLGYLAECNDAMARMYGFSSAAEIVGSRLGDLLPQSDPHNIEFLRNFIRGGYRLDDVESHEVDRDGNHKCFLNSLVGFVMDGDLVRAWGTQRDVTEQRQIEGELR
jgi:PAS domain-containing protein